MSGPEPRLLPSELFKRRALRWWVDQTGWFQRRRGLARRRTLEMLALWWDAARDGASSRQRMAGESVGVPRAHLAARVLKAWSRLVLHGAYQGPAIVDEEEEVFGDKDASPQERVACSHGLRKFLLEGQAEWARDGGVTHRPVEFDPGMADILDRVERARKRRPSTVVGRFEDCRAHVGTFWALEDFEGVDAELWALLEATKAAEEAQIESMRSSGEHLGFGIRREGCKKLEIDPERTRDWCEGARVEVDPDVPRYSKGPYPGVYTSLATVKVACGEFVKLLRWLVPLAAVPWIESRIQIVVKYSEWEDNGIKYHTVVDQTDSGLNEAVRLWKVGLCTALECIQKMGPGGLIFKMDLADCFYHWKLHPLAWTFMGIRHPLTGQSYVFPVLPMGFTLSPQLCCTYTSEVAAIIETEMRARWDGRPSERRAFEEVPRVARRAAGVEPGSDVYVDDFIHSISDGVWFEELVRVAEFVFVTLGLTEKKKKREGPGTAVTVLGFLFDTVARILRIPEEKLKELRHLLDSVLTRTAASQSVSHQELLSLVGKLQWSCSAVVLGRAYLLHVRKPLTAVMPLLKKRKDRERFCIPLYHFGRAVQELEWFSAALKTGGGSQAFHVGSQGKFEIWKWEEEYGIRVPDRVIQFASDASKRGCGFWVLQEWRSRIWTREEAQEHINVLECLMILHAMAEMGPAWRGHRVLGWCDNSTTVQAVNKGRSRSNLLMQIVRRIHLLCVEFSIHLWLCHIPGVRNELADELSRGLLSRRVRDWSLEPENMALWAKLVGGFTVDAWANPRRQCLRIQITSFTLTCLRHVFLCPDQSLKR